MDKKEYNKMYREKMKEKLKEYNKQWREKNKDYVKEKEKERNQSEHRKIWKKNYVEEHRENYNNYQKNWRKNNAERYSEIEKNRYINNLEKRKEVSRKSYKKRRMNDPIFKMSENVRRMINLSIQKKGYTKKSRAYEILGCTYDEFKTHIESQFEPWMNWDNYGKFNGEFNYGWDIDHIIPRSEIKTEDDIIKLNHFTNLKPLCSKYNRHIKKNNPN